MGPRNKYSLIGKRLSDSGLEMVQLTFEELNDLCPLPPTAYIDRPFWANTWRNNHARSWLEAGYVVKDVVLGKFIVFLHDPIRAKSPGMGRKNAFIRPVIQKSSAMTEHSISPAENLGYFPITTENIEKVHRLAITSPEYGSSFSLIEEILRRFPQNTDRDLVAMKVALIDVTNSTNLGKYATKITLAEFADYILSIPDFDCRVAQGDLDLVSQLSRNNGKINLFSLASKYCTYHNVDVYGRDDYSIFDGVVKRALPHYVHGLKESTVETWRKTYDYAAFEECIGNLLDQNGITIPFRRRKFDHFLWYANRKK